MQSTIRSIEENYLKKKVLDFKVGDTVKVHFRIQEGDKERVHVFEGVVIKKGGRGINTNFTVRKISYGVGVERIFPLHSPLLERVDIVSRGRVRRAKLYYLKRKKGKGTKIKKSTVSVPVEGVVESIEMEPQAHSGDEKKE